MTGKKEMVMALKKTNPLRSYSSWMQEPKQNIEQLYNQAVKLGLIAEVV